MGNLEIGIAALTLPALCLPWWTDWIWPTLGPEQLVGWQGNLVKTVLSLLVVLPPAMLMGMTLPVLAVAVLGSEGRLGREGIWLYALNTVGGVFGLLITALLTLPLAGVTGAMACGLGLNLCVAFFCLYIDTRTDKSESLVRDADDIKAAQWTAEQRGWLRSAMALSFVSGVAVLALEVLAIHLLSNIVYSSFPAATALLAVVILSLAVSASLVPRIIDRFGSPVAILPAVLAIAAIVTALSPFWFMFCSNQLATSPKTITSIGYCLRIVVMAMFTLGPALLVAGLVLPLTFALYDQRAGRTSSRWWGWLLAANGLGGLLGAELVGELIMPTLGMHLAIGSRWRRRFSLASFSASMSSRYGDVACRRCH